MRTLIALSLFLSPALAGAAGLPDFHYTDLKTLRETGAAVRAPAGAPADVVTEGHMLLQAGTKLLVGYADTPEQAAAGAAYWASVLNAAGVETGAMEYKSGLYTIPYKTADGRVIRSFLADPMQFPPKDEAGLRADMAATQAAMAAAGLTPLTARVVNLEYLLPTYSLLYLTKADAKPERESQLRVLKPGDDLDAEVFRSAGLAVISQPKPWMIVYAGPEAGHVGMIAGTLERAQEKLKARKELLKGYGKRILAEKITPIDEGDYKFYIELYFVEDTGAFTLAALGPAAAGRRTVCFISRVEKNDCVYACRDGREYRVPVREPDPWDPNTPVIACPQVVFPL
ncbi:MAG: hypothetical protein HY928_05450 [Elusimicrobia bacterium]|nr:hypothetical protein [Elusimicrobiota bacterium]